MEDASRIHILCAVVMLSGDAFIYSLGLPLWGTAGGIVLLLIWMLNNVTFGQEMLSLKRAVRLLHERN